MTLKAIPQRPMLYYEVMTSDNLMVCPICNGTGANTEYADLNLDLFNTQLSWGRKYGKIIHVCCPKCLGDGYIDWINSVIGNEPNECDKLFTDLRWNCVEFLFMLLSCSPEDYGEGMHYESGMHVFYGWENDLDQGLINFNKYKSIVSKYLKKNDRKWINAIINNAMVMQGKACTECFRIVPDEILIERFKNTYKFMPAIPDDEVNYKTFIIPDADFPLFRLCDDCNKNLTQREIDNLKKVAFDKNYTDSFSNEFIDKIDTFHFPEVYI